MKNQTNERDSFRFTKCRKRSKNPLMFPDIRYLRIEVRRMKKMMFIFAVALASIAGSKSVHAEFALAADPADLTFNGAGMHTVDFLITHNGVGQTTLSGYTIRFGSPADASQGLLPAGVTAVSATEGLVLPGTLGSTKLFDFNSSTNTVGASSFAGDATVPNGGTETLFSLDLNLGSDPSYTFGVDFQNAQRGGLFASQVGSEFFNPNSATTDFSFTLTNTLAAVPEPSSILTAATLGFAGVFYRRRRSKLGKIEKRVTT